MSSKKSSKHKPRRAPGANTLDNLAQKKSADAGSFGAKKLDDKATETKHYFYILKCFLDKFKLIGF